MILYKGMDAATLESEYNLVARRGLDDFSVLIERWLARSEAQRENVSTRIDLAYGPDERDKLDFFYSGDAHGPLLVYIHGGYWQRGDKNIYSFITESFINHGVSVAILNYNLTPSVRIGQIPAQIRKALAWCFHNSSELKFDKDKIHLMGHSAGGHLTAIMMETDWPAFDAKLPCDFIRSGIPISGVFELEPIVHTTLNAGPQMDITEAIAASPLFSSSLSKVPQLVVFGGGETAELQRQSSDYHAKFSTAERPMELYSVPDADHFDELEHLAKDDSVLFEKTLTMITS